MFAPRPARSDLLALAIEDLAGADGPETLWRRLHRQLDRFGIGAMIYGMEAVPDPAREVAPTFNSIDPRWLEDKLGNRLFECDEFVRAARLDIRPMLWSDIDLIARMTPDAKRSLAIDFDYGVTIGVTIPMRFADGLGASSIGLQADGVAWTEFERIWHRHRTPLIALVNAFDTLLRHDHLDSLYPLTGDERECLCWLAAGLAPKQVAARLGLTDKQVAYRLAAARSKLRAVTTPQAVATALIYGLITP